MYILYRRTLLGTPFTNTFTKTFPNTFSNTSAPQRRSRGGPRRSTVACQGGSPRLRRRVRKGVRKGDRKGVRKGFAD